MACFGLYKNFISITLIDIVVNAQMSMLGSNMTSLFEYNTSVYILNGWLHCNFVTSKRLIFIFIDGKFFVVFN